MDPNWYEWQSNDFNLLCSRLQKKQAAYISKLVKFWKIYKYDMLC